MDFNVIELLVSKVSSDWQKFAYCCKFTDECSINAIIERLNIIAHNDKSKMRFLLIELYLRYPKDYKKFIIGSLKQMKRNDVLRDLGIIKDISEIGKALKAYYLTNYSKINEYQPPLKTPANVDLMHKFVDLCIVNAANTQMDAFVEGKEFLEKQTNYEPILYSEIFINEKSVVLITGIAGIGKTWFLRKCLLDWSKNLIWKNFELVFYLEFKMLNQYQSVSSINELLNIFYKDVINDFNISNHSVLFIIDGLDKFKYLNEVIDPSLSCNYPIVNVLREIQKYKHVVAGRVYAIDQYQSICTEHSEKFTIQIMGFNINGINKYIENSVMKEKKEAVKATLMESPVAKAMASVPFYLSCMCKIINYSTPILTMTDLYANTFLYFLQEHIIKNNEMIYQIMENTSNKEYVFNICKIAYELLIKNKVFFSKEEIQTYISDFDKNEDNFLRFIEKIKTSLGYYYQFAHIAIMEFCASVYAYNCLSSDEIICNKNMESCLSIICGLTNKTQNSLLKFLVNLNPSKKPYQESSFLLSILDRLSCCENNLFIKCFYESQSSITDEIISIVDKRLRFSEDRSSSTYETESIIGKRLRGSCQYILIDDGKTFYETCYENYFVTQIIKSGRKLESLSVSKEFLTNEEKKLILQSATNVRNVYLDRSGELDLWRLKDKIEMLWINISDFLVTKEYFKKTYLPWIKECQGLDLSLHSNIDFIEAVYKWISRLKIKRFSIKHNGKDFNNHNK